MKNFCFTVDDNIRFLREICERGYESIFEHPYLAMYKGLHEKYDLKIQLNLFYEDKKFNLSEMSDRYRDEWAACSDWLRLSFHSRLENSRPYEFSGYDEVFGDCAEVQREIVRFASSDSLAKTTTLHYCLATAEGVAALKDNGVLGLLGLYGGSPSYQNSPEERALIDGGETVVSDGIAYAAIDVIMNKYSKEQILDKLSSLLGRELIKVMIHEQYFYADYPLYQPDFERKIDAAFGSLTSNGYKSIFFEEWTDKNEY